MKQKPETEHPNPNTRIASGGSPKPIDSKDLNWLASAMQAENIGINLGLELKNNIASSSLTKNNSKPSERKGIFPGGKS